VTALVDQTYAERLAHLRATGEVVSDAARILSVGECEVCGCSMIRRANRRWDDSDWHLATGAQDADGWEVLDRLRDDLLASRPGDPPTALEAAVQRSSEGRITWGNYSTVSAYQSIYRIWPWDHHHRPREFRKDSP